jgi:hypothetical protein
LFFEFLVAAQNAMTTATPIATQIPIILPPAQMPGGPLPWASRLVHPSALPMQCRSAATATLLDFSAVATLPPPPRAHRHRPSSGGPPHGMAG